MLLPSWVYGVINITDQFGKISKITDSEAAPNVQESRCYFSSSYSLWSVVLGQA